jgi:hypothetical protein
MRSTLRAALGRWVRQTDWGLVVTVAGFILLAPLSWLTLRLSPSLNTVYERALMEAGVMRPKGDVALRTIDPKMDQVRVASFATRQPESPLHDDTWVSLADQLRQSCVGAPDAARALQQILGLPPDPRPRIVYEMTVPREYLFRPCISSSDPAASSCSSKFSTPPPQEKETISPQKFADLSPGQKDENYNILNNNYTMLKNSYDSLRFVSMQMWNAYHVYDPGYPFTGMGWTYDWSPSSSTHIGVSEFIVRAGAKVKIEASTTPEGFCAAQK